MFVSSPQMDKSTYTLPADNFFYGITTVLSVCVNRKCICYTVLIFYPDFLLRKKQPLSGCPKIGAFTFCKILAKNEWHFLVKLNKDECPQLCQKLSPLQIFTRIFSNPFWNFQNTYSTESLSITEEQGYWLMAYVMGFCMRLENAERPCEATNALINYITPKKFKCH